MGKFIDRQKLEAHFSPAITGKEAYTAGEVLLSIQKFPSADVVPVIHAHWRYMHRSKSFGLFVGACSNCGSPNIVADYCGNCGAKMDEE